MRAGHEEGRPGEVLSEIRLGHFVPPDWDSNEGGNMTSNWDGKSALVPKRDKNGTASDLAFPARVFSGQAALAVKR